jgi:hypothetical protein
VEIKTPKTIMVAQTNCTDPAKEDEFKKWYLDIHFHDILARGTYYTATLFANPSPQEGDRKFLAIYESDREMSELQAPPRPAGGPPRDPSRMTNLLKDGKTALYAKAFTYVAPERK